MIQTVINISLLDVAITEGNFYLMVIDTSSLLLTQL